MQTSVSGHSKRRRLHLRPQQQPSIPGHSSSPPSPAITTVLHLRPDVTSISTKNDLEVETVDYAIVCDICGDVGQEDLLAICSTCKDGAEHTYCMKLMINEVPRGDWQCEECKSSEELNCSNYDKKGSTGSNHRNAEMGQMFDVLNVTFNIIIYASSISIAIKFLLGDTMILTVKINMFSNLE
ncbi:hypothetical protein L2E82_49785 [Cichorium intybus]|uniref:Uncharacterized protein n=1 Tax=Cichorium intybus TaxID=13427 RepID=A0ACB8Z1T5_CICIN|nr:hypothetical protein L2E82_49785 [Cichorium intybus]